MTPNTDNAPRPAVASPSFVADVYLRTSKRLPGTVRSPEGRALLTLRVTRTRVTLVDGSRIPCQTLALMLPPGGTFVRDAATAHFGRPCNPAFLTC